MNIGARMVKTMAKFPSIAEIAEQVKEIVLEEILIEDKPLGELIESGNIAYVIKCEECRYLGEMKADGWSCMKHEGCLRTTLNGFCAWAERKEDNGK